MAIRTLNYFDLKEDDDYNFKLLHYCRIKELESSEGGCSLLHLAYKGNCQKFVNTLIVQKTVAIMWQSFDMEVNKMRKDKNKQKLKTVAEVNLFNSIVSIFSKYI